MQIETKIAGNDDKTNKINRIKLYLQSLNKQEALQLITLALCIQVFLEILNHRSISGGLGFVISNPLMFLFNVFLILFTLSFTGLTTRRTILLAILSVLWLGLGMANFIVQSFRLTPLSAMDFYFYESKWKEILQYLNIPLLILVLSILAAVIGVLIYLWKSLQKSKRNIKLSILIMGISTAFMAVTSALALRSGALSNHFGNLMEPYKDYGFAYCFANSIIDRGIKITGDYNEQRMDELLIKLEKNTTNVDNAGKAASQPNIILIQLESFFDANYLSEVTYSENPVPNFTKLKEEYTSGFLTVPVYGAGTINTEFEVLTGMSTEFFGTGEYPYRTILNSTTSESICYNLTELGYRNYILHNNTATFYNRNEVFPMLGFDHFVSIEYMHGVEHNLLGWSKDKVLTAEIQKALEADAAKDFIYAISVQPHGTYPTTPTEPTKIRLNENSDLEESYKNQLEYYVNQLTQTDQMIKELTDRIAKFDEPTVIVFFGDHLPPLNIDNEDVAKHNKYQTEYVLWSNYSMEKEHKDLTAYQLNAYVLERIGYDNGMLTKLHQNFSDREDYLEDLELLQYDMLYGNRYIFDGEYPHLRKEMKMGIYEPEIHDLSIEGDAVIVKGSNFTPWSVVFINDLAKDTTYLDENTLQIPYEELTEEDLYVAQVTDKGEVLSQGKEYDWRTSYQE